jgi:hypothetical protein
MRPPIYTGHLRRGRRPWPLFFDPRTPLSTDQVASFLGVERRTLWRWYKARIGPPCIDPQKTEWRVRWFVAGEVFRWREGVLGEPVPTIEQMIHRWHMLMLELNVPSFTCRPPLKPRPFKHVENWRPKGLRKCKRRRSQKSRSYTLLLNEGAAEATGDLRRWPDACSAPALASRPAAP